MNVTSLCATLLAISATITLVLALIGWRRRAVHPAARPFAALMLMVSLYSGGYALELSCSVIPLEQVGSRVEYIGISFLPAFWLLLALQFRGVVYRVPRVVIALLFAIPLVTLAIVYHDSYWSRQADISLGRTFSLFLREEGPWYWLHVVYANFAVLIGNALFLSMMIRSARHFRTQTAVMLAGSLLPWSALIVHFAGAVPWGIDPIPFVLATTGPLYAYGLFRFRLFDLAPMARTTLVDTMADAMFVFNRDQRLVDFNRAAGRMFSVSHQSIGELQDTLFAPMPQILQAMTAGGGVVEDCGLQGAGMPRVVQVSVTSLEGRWRGESGSLVLVHDISDLKRAEVALRDSEEKFRLLFEAAPDPILLLDDSCRYIDCNGAAVRILGLASRGQVLNRGPADFSPERQADGSLSGEMATKVMAEAFARGSSAIEWTFLRRDGNPFIADVSITVVSIKGVRVQLIHWRDITDKKQVEERLRELSLIDELTGLHNRRGFMTLATQQIKIADRLGQGLTLLYADVDDLKLINDTYGHQEGDRALNDAAAVLRASFRASDIIARLGGDEFAGLVLESGDETEAAVLTRLQENLNAHNLLEQRPYRLSISYGTAAYDVRQPSTVQELLARGDKDMYRYKQRKKQAAG